MALRLLRSLAYTDDELYDRAKGMPSDYTPPEYPGGMCFCIPKDDLEKAGGADAAPNQTMRFSAIGEVTNTFQGREDCRIEVELTQFAGEDGKFFELSSPAHICFCGPELEKVEMSDNAERGDMVHLIGTVRVESLSDNEYGGPTVSLQIIELKYEDASAQSREG